ncbi:acyl-CoA dehydrogenase family protein [Streptomyces collinus]|uniref:acyl-CoA dehydrogenase family protein n=1 Tax=Streptomyces collinus TaxID=42684 RepID=UPI00294310EF|nr:acyl-CoA dehydrogenase family protein [Streptomyces collinus]
MDLHESADVALFRASVRDFIAQLVPGDWQGIGALDRPGRREFTARARAALAERGWVAPAWPAEYGGAGLGPTEQIALGEELGRAGIPTGAESDTFGISMLGNTMLRHSPPELCERFLPRIVSGEYVFCQGFSEPGAGSDLAALATRAAREGDRWVINGQKLWSSSAHLANWMFVLARTDPAAPPYRGISMLLVPLDQPGVEIRSIRNLTGEAHFHEVFFADAVTDADLVVGGEGQGWRVAMTLLGFERAETYVLMPIKLRDELERLTDLAVSRGLRDDPDIRQRLAWCHVQVEQLRCQSLRLATRLVDGHEPGPQAAVVKLLTSEYHRKATELAMDVLGLDALAPVGEPSPNWYYTDDPGAPNSSASWTSVYLNARAATIYGGSSQIQRGIIGDILLGLPKEPRPQPTAAS